MSKIEITINTTGSVVESNMRFTPSMVNATIETADIYFPPNFILNDKNILKAVKESSSVMEILTKHSMYDKLVRYYTDEARGYKKISIEQEKNNGIIKTNVEYMKQLWFKPKTKILIKNRAYTIIKSDVVKTKIGNYQVKKKLPNIIFQMTVNIQLIKDNSWTGRKQVTCEEKRDGINNIYRSLFNKPFFSYREQTNRYTEAPVMYSNNDGSVSSYVPTKPAQVNQQQPHIINNYYLDRNATNDSLSRPLFKTTGGKKRTYKRLLQRRRRFKRTRGHRI